MPPASAAHPPAATKPPAPDRRPHPNPRPTTYRRNLIGALYSPDYDRTVKEENRAIGLTIDHRFAHDPALNVFFRSEQSP